MNQFISNEELDDISYFYYRYVDAVKSNDMEKILKSAKRLTFLLEKSCQKIESRG